MARRRSQPAATREEILKCVRQECPECGGPLWNKYDNYRSIRTLQGCALTVESSALQNQIVKVPLCLSTGTRRWWALPQYEFGLDVMALAVHGATKSIEVYQIHQQLQQRGFALVSAVSVTCWNAMTS